jgi:predicted adenylyl cyclase CyaB
MSGREREVERKARVSDPGALERRLLAGGVERGRSDKEDRYYLIGWSPGRPIDMAADPIFRVRIERDEAVLGYKTRRFEGATEINDEREIPLGDPGPVRHWLETYLGLRPFVVKHKRTRLFRLAGFERANVELNEVDGLGHFLEVEVICAADEIAEAVALIDAVFAELDVDDSDVEPRYYIDLLMSHD